jgi:hypothetical protein
VFERFLDRAPTLTGELQVARPQGQRLNFAFPKMP